VVAVARLVEKKGLHDLIDACGIEPVASSSFYSGAHAVL
jgi:hypothetical protein